MCPKNRKIDKCPKCPKYFLKPYYLRSPVGCKVNVSTVFNRIIAKNVYFRIFLMAHFGPRADRPPIFGPGQAGQFTSTEPGQNEPTARPKPNLEFLSLTL